MAAAFIPSFLPGFFSKSVAIEVVKMPRFFSRNLGKSHIVDIYLPPGYRRNRKQFYKVLYANDGQDMADVRLKQTLSSFFAEGKLQEFIVVAIHADADRIHEYGVATQADYKKRGAKASLYSAFVLDEVMPYMEQNFRILKGAENTAIMGFSLGGLSACDLAWNNPQKFTRAGVFSGSFWWRQKAYEDGYTDADRIMQKHIREGVYKPGLKFWFQVGTLDETNDRNNDGIIDAIDDTRAVITELSDKGYTVYDIAYHEMEGGEHNQKTWARALPVFLEWAFGE